MEHLHLLPIELLIMVLMYLDTKDIISFRRTSRHLNAVTLYFFKSTFFKIHCCRHTSGDLKALFEVSRYPDLRVQLRHVWIHPGGSGVQLTGTNYVHLSDRLKAIFDGLPNLVGIGPVKHSSLCDRIHPHYLTRLTERYLDDGRAFGSPLINDEWSDDLRGPTAFASAVLEALIESGKELTHLAFEGSIALELLDLAGFHWQNLPKTLALLADLVSTIRPSCTRSQQSDSYLIRFLEAAQNVNLLDLTAPHGSNNNQSLDDTILTWNQILAVPFQQLKYLRLKNVIADREAVARFLQVSISTIINLEIDVTSTVEELADATKSWQALIENVLESAPRLRYVKIGFPCETGDESRARRDTITWTKGKGFAIDTWWHNFDDAPVLDDPPVVDDPLVLDDSPLINVPRAIRGTDNPTPTRIPFLNTSPDSDMNLGSDSVSSERFDDGLDSNLSSHNADSATNGRSITSDARSVTFDTPSAFSCAKTPIGCLKHRRTSMAGLRSPRLKHRIPMWAFRKGGMDCAGLILDGGLDLT